MATDGMASAKNCRADPAATLNLGASFGYGAPVPVPPQTRHIYPNLAFALAAISLFAGTASTAAQVSLGNGNAGRPDAPPPISEVDTASKLMAVVGAEGKENIVKVIEKLFHIRLSHQGINGGYTNIYPKTGSDDAPFSISANGDRSYVGYTYVAFRWNFARRSLAPEYLDTNMCVKVDDISDRLKRSGFVLSESHRHAGDYAPQARSITKYYYVDARIGNDLGREVVIAHANEREDCLGEMTVSGTASKLISPLPR